MAGLVSARGFELWTARFRLRFARPDVWVMRRAPNPPVESPTARPCSAAPGSVSGVRHCRTLQHVPVRTARDPLVGLLVLGPRRKHHNRNLGAVLVGLQFD